MDVVKNPTKQCNIYDKEDWELLKYCGDRGTEQEELNCLFCWDQQQ